MKRNLILSPAFKEFEQSANPRTREKLRYAISILETVYPIPPNSSRNWPGQTSSSCGCPDTGHPLRRGQRQHQSGDKRHPAERLCEEKHQGL